MSDSTSEGAATLLWFRRDLRTADHPAMLRAAGGTGRVLGLFVLDEALLGPAGEVRPAYLFRCLHALNEQLRGRLLVVRGDPVQVLPRVALALGTATVHITSDAGPYGRRRDRVVGAALAANGVELVATGSPYAIAPGRVLKGDGRPYKVFTPFYRAWREHGWPEPAATSATTVSWIDPESVTGLPHRVAIEDRGRAGEITLPAAGEVAALRTWDRFREEKLGDYRAGRDRPDRSATSHLSPYLRWGCIHPRTVLAELVGDRSDAAESCRSEIAWREFYSDVLWHHPDSARRNLNRKFDGMRLDTDAAARELFDAWRSGMTGYPIVDAGMRSLRKHGWMHNRVRMVVASFLVKDLHLPWWWGARHFMRYLIDGDLASNQHGWQWAAGTGTDAAPYFRIFNPTAQGERFDPDGSYVRAHIPELSQVSAGTIHRPWTLWNGPPNGYPLPLVDHPAERQVALKRYGEIKS